MKKTISLLILVLGSLFAGQDYMFYKGYHPAFGQIDLQIHRQKDVLSSNILFSKNGPHIDVYMQKKGDTLKIIYPQSSYAVIKNGQLLLNWEKDGRTYKIKLKESKPEFPNITLERHVALDPGNTEGPGMSYTLYADHIEKPIIADQSEGFSAFNDPAAFFEEQYQLYSEDYKSLAGLFQRLPGSASLNYEYIDFFEILYRDKQRLSLRQKHFAFTGGAHPNTVSTHRIIDRETGKTINFDDLFIENAEKEIKPLLDEAMNKMFEPDNIEERLFSTDYPVSRDIYLTKRGVVFQYDAYEIACYAQGPIEVFLPFRKIRKLMKDF